MQQNILFIHGEAQQHVFPGMTCKIFMQLSITSSEHYDSVAISDYIKCET